MIKIVRIEQTCMACPSQWDAWTDDDRFVFIHYRWGFLSIHYSGTDERIFTKDVDGEYGGVMNLNELIEHTKEVIDWSSMQM